jgi:DNA processing protein
VSSACDDCLRRAHLVAALAPRIAGLLDRPARPSRALLALDDDDLVQAVAGAGATAAALLEGFHPEQARKRAAEAEVVAVCRHERGYPAPLRELVDVPAVLFARGRTGMLRALGAEPAVAIVGSRRPTPYGLEIAQALGRGLAAAGVTVVSGLALGVDAAAHRGCLEIAGFPVAVLAGGPDAPYPRSH